MNSVFYLRREAQIDDEDEIPRLQLLQRFQGADMYADLALHRGGADVLCPISEDEDELDGATF